MLSPILYGKYVSEFEASENVLKSLSYIVTQLLPLYTVYYSLCFSNNEKPEQRKVFVFVMVIVQWLCMFRIQSTVCVLNVPKMKMKINIEQCFFRNKCTFIILWRCESFVFFPFVAFELIKEKTELVFTNKKKCFHLFGGKKWLWRMLIAILQRKMPLQKVIISHNVSGLKMI